MPNDESPRAVLRQDEPAQAELRKEEEMSDDRTTDPKAPSRQADAGVNRPGLTRRAALLSGAAAAAFAPGMVRKALGQGGADSPPARPAVSSRSHLPPVPWKAVNARWYPPGVEGRDYLPVHTPNGVTLRPKVVDGVKVYHLIAEPIQHELAQGLTVTAWGYNGRTPGPTLELVEGDRARIYVTNRLPAMTTVHWHGLILPNGMDGVPGLTQPAIHPGETSVYEFTFPFPGTFMYHPHVDAMTEEGTGMVGMIVVHPRRPRTPLPDRDYAIMLMEWDVVGGTSRPNPNEMVDFNLLTMNGKAFPDTEPLVAGLGERVRIRLGNLSQMSHHPIHLHGYAFHITATDGGAIPASAQWPETTVLVPVGSTRDIEFVADNPGDWLMHCHMTHHMMNQMGHETPNMVGVSTPARLERKIRHLLPAYMTMGEAGMEDMATMRMAMPENSVPMRGFTGQYGATIMGGMATVLKVRDRVSGYEVPGWYEHSAADMPALATTAQLEADGIDPTADAASNGGERRIADHRGPSTTKGV